MTIADARVQEVAPGVHEPSGPGHVHTGRNEGDAPLVLDVVYVLPAGAPLSVPQDAPACDAAG
ncbi:hypothetical protein BJF78_01615 [Pseudonocardia sp. CNS-139]|nr:hypothetical protein BJF78_01615 [Pseudonocardia sp. CNS-139]